MYLGPKAGMIISSGHITQVEAHELKKICRAFYIARFVNKSKVELISMTHAIALQSLSPSNLGDSLVPLILLFPNLVPESDIEDLEDEWRQFLNQSIVSSSLEFEHFWFKFFNLKNCLDEVLYPKLVSFVKPLLAMPHSSANTERIFSQLFLIKNKQRNRLSTSTITAILAAKDLLNGDNCSTWIPSPDLIKHYYKHGCEK